ncbi:MAG TPA: glycerophosphodiester phosphodiesterase [Mycobacteriales bacterium]|jgi:glycerophosphoryl diester phosphodiesterase|nr:glycerophosphodiester phosphodiesterase [Mycobacteriales bacterium]
MRYAFAHRGGRAHGPDNNLATFAEALARGARALETDAWVTADGVVVLDHDGLHRAGTPDEVAITAVRRAELAAHIPTLAELYAQCGTDFDLAIDVKGEGGADAICQVAREHDAEERLWLFTPSSTRPGEIKPAHAGVTVRARQLRDRGARQVLLRQLRDDGVEVINSRWPYWRRSAVADVHALGLLAFAWDVQWSIAVGHARRIGIDGIFSDHVGLLEGALR